MINSANIKKGKQKLDSSLIRTLDSQQLISQQQLIINVHESSDTKRYNNNNSLIGKDMLLNFKICETSIIYILDNKNENIQQLKRQETKETLIGQIMITFEVN